jgi:hypothetical protein
MSGALYAIQRPNRIEFLVNSHTIATWEVMGDGPFTPVRFHLNPGEHSIVFASSNPAILVPPDTRPLALVLVNLLILVRGPHDTIVTPRAARGKFPVISDSPPVSALTWFGKWAFVRGPAPNIGLEPTGNSVRSSLAPAARRA